MNNYVMVLTIMLWTQLGFTYLFIIYLLLYIISADLTIN